MLGARFYLGRAVMWNSDRGSAESAGDGGPWQAEIHTADDDDRPVLETGADRGFEACAPVAPATRTLIVDDHRDAADSLCTLMRMLGKDARVASDGHEALAIAAAFRPAVVVMDI